MCGRCPCSRSLCGATCADRGAPPPCFPMARKSLRTADTAAAGATPQRFAARPCGNSENRFRIACGPTPRSEEHTSELQSLMRISYAVFCLKQKKKKAQQHK